MKNVPQLSVNKILEQFKLIYGSCIEKKISFGYVFTPYLWGPPGIGKSTIVRELAKYLEETYHKKVNLVDLRLYEYAPTDLKGVPYPDEKREFTKWLLPQLLNFDPSENTINILFFDEFLSAKESVQAVGLQIVLDRKVDQYSIPDNTIIIAASNRKEDRSFVSNMSMALANRFAHYEVTNEVNEWKEYAYAHHIDSRIIAFITFHPDYLIEDIKEAGVAFCSPRSLEKLSNLISLTDQIQLLKPSIASYIGEGIATEFIAFTKVADSLSTFDEVKQGKGKIPAGKDGLYTMICMITSNLYCQAVTDRELNQIYRYIGQLPKDYQLAFLADHKKFFEENKLRIQGCPAYQAIITNIGRYM